MSTTSILAHIMYITSNISPLVPTYIHLILAALFPIYTGAHASLIQPRNTKLESQKRSKHGKIMARNFEIQDEQDDITEEEDDQPALEKLTKSDAIMFPIVAGVTLCGLYLAIKYFSAELINRILGYYFVCVGFFSVGRFSGHSFEILSDFLFPVVLDKKKDITTNRSKSKSNCDNIETNSSQPENLIHSTLREKIRSPWRLKLIHNRREIYKFSINSATIIGYIVSVIVIKAYFLWEGNKPWYLTNILGISLSYNAMQLLSPSSFPIASLILTVLFFYDIFFVFYTPLMVTVASSLDLPIKLLFPRPPPQSITAVDKPSLAMLGLGDIVLPGIVISLGLRFDLWKFYEIERLKLMSEDGQPQIDSQNLQTHENLDKNAKPVFLKATGLWGSRFRYKISNNRVSGENIPLEFRGSRFPKIYFYAGIIGYTVGMAATIIVMHVFHHAQPALLYLVPAVLISIWGTAWARGELRWALEWTEDEDENVIDVKNNSENKKNTLIKPSRQDEKGLNNDVDFKNLYLKWVEHRTMHPTSPQYKSLKVALDSSVGNLGPKNSVAEQVSALIREDQEPAYHLLSKLVRKQIAVEGNPFVFREGKKDR